MTLQRFVLDEDVERERVDKVLSRLCDGTSRATLQRWIGEGRVRMNGVVCRARDAVRGGAVLEVDVGTSLPTQARPDSSVAFSVLYEDDDLAVVDKPAGLVVHPAKGHWEGTLVNGLLAREGFGAAGAEPGDPMAALRPGIVHRIDKGTSGVLVVAKTEFAREALKLQLQAHTVERRYLAITVGVPRVATIRTAYGRDPRSRLRFSSLVSQGKPAITHITVLSSLASGRAALVECRLETGRTHQIRVHMLEQAKTPLLGDPLYKRPTLAPDLAELASQLGRQALHASVLGFVHPRTGDTRRFETPLPADMQAALERLR